MVIGAMNLKLAIFGAVSLKDKRRVVKSLKERLINKFSVSVAEVGLHERYQQAELGVAMVGRDRRYVESCLAKIVDYVRSDRSASLVDYETEFF
jgi:uncharacterized protein